MVLYPRIGIRELKQQASAVMRHVAGGEVVEVTKHGRPVARVVPLKGGTLDQMVAEGRATAARGDLLTTMAELGLPLTPVEGLPLPSEVLAELRAGER
jgi:prevent-host-death family protein